MVAQWYKDQIKGSNLAKHRHRVSLVATLFTVALGLAVSFTPVAINFREDMKNGKYHMSPQAEERRAAFRLGHPNATRAFKGELLEEVRESGLEDYVPLPDSIRDV